MGNNKFSEINFKIHNNSEELKKLNDAMKAYYNKYTTEIIVDKTKYKTERVSIASTVHYPDFATQLDQLYHDMADGKLGVGATTGSWFVGITTVKTAHPKP